MSFNPSSLGSGIKGIAPPLLGGGAGVAGGSGPTGSSSRARNRFALRTAWNGAAAFGSVASNTGPRQIALTPFRAVNNAGDLLARKDYVCGGSNQVNNIRRASNAGWKGLAGHINSKCDNTGVVGASCNPQFVYDSSDYSRYKKQRAINRNYNDSTFGGDAHNGSYVALMAVRRF